MQPLPIQTDIISLVGLIGGAFAAGVIISLFLMRIRRKKSPYRQLDAEEDLCYLILSDVKHFLDNASDVIIGQLKLLGGELPTNPQRWKVAYEVFNENALNFESMAKRLAVISRLGVEEQPLINEPVNVAALLDEIMTKLDPVADAKGIELETVVDKEMVRISADKLALEEVFANIIENAIKYNNSNKEDKQATEILARVMKYKDNVVVTISDDGKGMSQEQVAGIFDKAKRSYQAGGAKGTGMGLYLTKLLIELHGGDINVNSKLGQSTEFQITLPLNRSA